MKGTDVDRDDRSDSEDEVSFEVVSSDLTSEETSEETSDESGYSEWRVVRESAAERAVRESAAERVVRESVRKWRVFDVGVYSPGKGCDGKQQLTLCAALACCCYKKGS